MTEQHDETIYFERITMQKVSAACARIFPGQEVEITPSLFDAMIVIRHSTEQPIAIEQADLLAQDLREGRLLTESKADWHVANFGLHHDFRGQVIGTGFALICSLLPCKEALERFNAN